MQDINLPFLGALGIGLVVLFFGYFFGLFEGQGRGYKKRKKEDEQEKKSSIPPPAPLPPPVSPDNSLLKLFLDRSNQPSLELDGKRVDTSSLTPDERARLIDLMVTMRPWVQPGSGSQNAQVAPSIPRPLAAQTPSLSAYSPQSKPTPPVVSPTPPPPPLTPPVVQKEEAAPTSMVGQIDAILQKTVVGTPLANLGIRLIESPQGGVVVTVGVNKYAGVGDVPDPQVQAAIKAAIAVWEKKYTPG